MIKAVPYQAEYAEKFYQWYYDDRLSEYFRENVTGLSKAQAMNAGEFMRAHLVVGLQDQIPVALASFALINPIARIMKFGLMVDPDWQHQNVAREYTESSLRWCFNVLNPNRLEARILKTNERLLQGMRLFGFTEEGTLRESCYFNGQYHDEVLISYLKKDFYKNFGGSNGRR